MHPTAEVSEGSNRNSPAWNTMVQLLDQSHMHSVTDRHADGHDDAKKVKRYSYSWETHLIATGRDLPYGIT